jgi:hypothetical protein
MMFHGVRSALLTGAAIFALFAPSALAQNMSAQAVKDAAIIDVPLVLGDIDAIEAADRLWASGDQPANTLLARFSVKPLQVATMAPTGAEPTETLLWRVFKGGGITTLRLDDLQLTEGPRYFCSGNAGGPILACFMDGDGDGSFDQVAQAMPERGAKPYHITIIKAFRPLDTPLPYRILDDARRPAITIELRNCAKDYDRPRYVALSTADRNIPLTTSAFAWHDKDSSFAYCRRGIQRASLPGVAVDIPNGGYLAEMGPFAFTVGPKKDAKLALAGPVDPNALYRLEGATLVNMSIGHTPNQAQLIALKKFPYPILMTDEGAVIHDGQLPAGGTLATIPFHHAYRGTLTQDVTISNLLGKRSLAAGTVVYGFPARSRLTMTRGGMPAFQTVDDDEFRTVNLQLTWCAPVHDADPGKEKPSAVGKGGWSAACIPYSTLGNHTIITDLQPAFSVTGVSYNATTSSNDGPPPVERHDDSSFGQRLRVEYVYEGKDEQFVSLSERIYFGDALTSSAPKKLYAPSGKVTVTIAGTQAELTLTEPSGLIVKSSGATLAGANPLLTWDQRALMLQQIQKMGLRPAEPQADAPDTAPAGTVD